MTSDSRQLHGSSNRTRSQLLCRRLNEQIRSIAGQEDLCLVCECVSPSCFARVILPLAAYEAVRRFPTRFVVREGHVDAEVERAVESRDGVVVVEKIGADAERAIVFDPRRPAERRAHDPEDAGSEFPLAGAMGA